MATRSGQLVITDRSGVERQVIAMRQDEHDLSKWHLAEAFELAAYESAHLRLDGQTTGVLYGRGPSGRANTIFHSAG